MLGCFGDKGDSGGDFRHGRVLGFHTNQKQGTFTMVAFVALPWMEADKSCRQACIEPVPGTASLHSDPPSHGIHGFQRKLYTFAMTFQFVRWNMGEFWSRSLQSREIDCPCLEIHEALPFDEWLRLPW